MLCLYFQKPFSSFCGYCICRSKLKAVRLQNYWKKICEDERKSQWRNEQLLRDFDRVEAHMADLHSRTGRLRTMKVLTQVIIERLL